tara:strand:- start:20107 stop:20577 length:471 start_codon:yes stop_codon:yes gene_type:complete
MKKKGVSPLIATVLLVGFVIIIAVLIWLWYGNVIEERAEKEGAKISGEFSCATDVSISVALNDCRMFINPYTFVNFDLTNDGLVDLNGIRIIVEGSDGTETLGVSKVFGKTTTRNIGEKYDATQVGTAETVTIIPTVESGPSTITCSEQQVVLDCS